ncbi:MAG: hypothetical protein ACRD11_04805 [Terriglobia bacterium]
MGFPSPDNYRLQLLENRGALRHETPTSAKSEVLPLHDPVSQRAIEFIKAHYAEDLSLRGMARLLEVSDRHLRQRFRESVGVTPIRHLVDYRVERAKNPISDSR